MALKVLITSPESSAEIGAVRQVRKVVVMKVADDVKAIVAYAIGFELGELGIGWIPCDLRTLTAVGIAKELYGS
jgi:hypothetical protein